jgi:hydrogenase maturation protease
VAVIGVGNILMRDEGLGVHALALLRATLGELARCLEVVDAGTALGDVIEDYAGCAAIVIIDAVRGGGEPGAIYRFDPQAVDGARHAGTMTSLHEISVMDALVMMRLAGGRLPTVRVIGMEPRTIEPGLEMSNVVKERLPQLVETVLDELRNLLRADRKAEKHE